MPAKQKPEIDPYAPTNWGVLSEDLTCPSGQRCLVRRIDPMKLMSDGTLHKTDMLTSMVHQQHVAKKAKGGKDASKAAEMQTEKVLFEALKDPVKMAEIVDTVNSVVLATVIKPELQPALEDETERVDGLVYVSDVELNDRMFIMQFAFGGTRAAAKFLEQLDESVDRLANVKSVENSAE